MTRCIRWERSMAIETQPEGAMPGSFRFLLVEDNPLDVELVQRELRRAGFEFTAAVVQTPEDFTREIRACRPHVVLADYNLPHWRRIAGIAILEGEGVGVPRISVTGARGEVQGGGGVRKK